MSFDTFIMPPAPQPAVNTVNSSAGAETAPPKHDRAQCADQKESFLATLNRVSERKSSAHDRSGAADNQACRSAEPHKDTIHAAGSHNSLDQDVVQEGAAKSDLTESIAETPLVRERPVMNLFHLLFSDDGAFALQDQTHPAHLSTPAALNAFIGLFQSEGQTTFSGLLDIGPFEQLQTDISPEASNLSFLKQLLNRAIVHQFVAEPSGPQADNSILAYWRSLTEMPVEGDSPNGQMGQVANRVDTPITYLLQRMVHPSSSSDFSAPAVEADGKQTVLNGEANSFKEDGFWQKIMRTTQAADTAGKQMTQPTGAENDSRLSAGSAKLIQTESLLQPHLQKGGQQTEIAIARSMAKGDEPAVTPNASAANNGPKLTQDMFSLKSFGVQNDLFASEQTGTKVIQIDGEAKDSGFWASQESLPEHLTKLEHASRAAEGTQRSLAAQTMNQIVQKAVLLNNNGQHTVQIDLKPDFLGHIRMQIVTESSQVAVRIMAEIPFVKDMLESNLIQLKAELQAQGLEVDELEVSVAHDSRADDDLYQKAAEARRAKASKNNRHSIDATAEEQRITQPVRGHGLAESAIDFYA